MGTAFCHCWRTLCKQKIFFKILVKKCVPCIHVSTVKHIAMTSLLCVRPYQGFKSDHWLAPWMATSMCVGFNVLLDFPILTPGAYLACLPSMGWGTWLIPGVPILSHPPSPHKPNPFIRNSFPLPQGCKNTDREQVELVSFLAKTNWTKKNWKWKAKNPQP